VKRRRRTNRQRLLLEPLDDENPPVGGADCRFDRVALVNSQARRFVDEVGFDDVFKWQGTRTRRGTYPKLN
jgi:hypothetical protein